MTFNIEINRGPRGLYVDGPHPVAATMAKLCTRGFAATEYLPKLEALDVGTSLTLSTTPFSIRVIRVG